MFVIDFSFQNVIWFHPKQINNPFTDSSTYSLTNDSAYTYTDEATSKDEHTSTLINSLHNIFH